jgi:hypothetical protein
MLVLLFSLVKTLLLLLLLPLPLLTLLLLLALLLLALLLLPLFVLRCAASITTTTPCGVLGAVSLLAASLTVETLQ